MNRIQKSYYGLGTIINLTLFGNPKIEDLEQTNKLIQNYEEMLTVNRLHSEVMEINQAAGLHEVTVSDATYSLIKQAVLLSREQFGFNVFIGPLVKLWRIGFDEARVPANDEINKRIKLTNPQNCLLDDENTSVFLTRQGMELDLGAIAKGYIADRIKDYWQAIGKRSGIIDLGGNLLLMGNSPLHQDEKWTIGIQNPDISAGNSIASVHFKACSAVTSGIYERRLEVKGKSYHHILDPKSGMPHDNNLASVTVFSKYSIDGEIETTRLFFAGSPQNNWGIDRTDLYGAVFVTKNKKIILQKLPHAAITLLDDQYELIYED